jgi:tetratricopeptide (TPR) repeat protein
MSFKPVLILSFVLNCLLLFPQPKKWTTVEDADEHFSHRNYFMAIETYKAELKKDPDNLKIKYRLGISYLNTRINRNEAIPLLEEVSRNPKADPEVWLYLGEAYHLVYRLEEALASYEKFKALNPKMADVASLHMRQCNNAIELVRKPVSVSFQNLGQGINSSEPDYNPFVDEHEMFMVFTSRRRETWAGRSRKWMDTGAVMCT